MKTRAKVVMIGGGVLASVPTVSSQCSFLLRASVI